MFCRALTISLLLTASASPLPRWARADEIRTPEQAETLCNTASPEVPVPTEGTAQDPVLQARRHRDYTTSRYRRLTDVYSVILDARDYSFMPVEPGLLTIAAWQPFPMVGGTYELDLGNAPDFSFSVGEAERDEIEAGCASDQVQLRLYFHLISLDHPELAYCEVTDHGATRVLGRLLAADLIGRNDEQAIAHTETERYQWSRVRFGIDTPGDYEPPLPRVTVTSTSTSPTELTEGESEALRAEAEARMMPCYLRGLNQNGRLQGAMVVSLEVDSGSAVTLPSVTIDAIDQPLVTACVIGALNQLPIGQTGTRTRFNLRMTVIFRLE